MAVTTAADYTVNIQEMLANLVLMEAADQSVLMPWINHYSINGMAGKDSLVLSRQIDPGEATAGTEGTDFITNTTVGTTGSTLTPTEGAIAQIKITHDAVEERTGLPSMSALINTNDEALIRAGLALEIGVISRMVMRKWEQDVTALLPALNSGVFAGTNTVDATLSDFLTGLTLLENQEGLPHNDLVCFCDIEFFANLRDDFLTGNYPSAVLNLDIASFVEHRADMPRLGVQGGAVGIPLVRFGATARETATGVFSALVLRGDGAPETEGSGQIGTFAMVEGRPLTIDWDKSVESRATTVQANSKYVIGERADEFGQAFETDAP